MLGIVDSAYIQTAADSAHVQSKIPHAYIQARVPASYIQANQTSYNTSDFPDSAGVNTLANARIAATAIGGLSNVSSTGASTGQILKWSGSEWAPAADGLDSALTTQLVDSAYIQARQVDLVRDSGFISGIIDSNHINSRLGVFSVSPITTEFLYTVDSGNTVIFGNDDVGKSLVIDSNNFEIFLNGIRLQSTDYVDSAASNRITLNNSLDSGDEISVVTTTQQNTLTGVGVLPGIVDSAYIEARFNQMIPATNSFTNFRYSAIILICS